MAKINSAPITNDFLNSETGQPFSECMMCNTSLTETQYVVEKAFRNYPSLGTKEVIFEYAMCMQCAAKMHFELSEESRSRITAYLSSHITRKSFQSTDDIDSSVKNCVVRSTDLSDSSEYSIYALCDGQEMILGEFPYGLSGEAQDEIMKLLSAKTLEVMDDFIGKHFTGPPEVMDILRRKPIFI